MDFSYPAEVEQFRKELRAWLAVNLTHDVVTAGRRSGHDPVAFDAHRAWNRTLADAGWAAVSWPPDYGGRGATVLEQLVYAEETTRVRAPLPLNVIGMNNIAPAIMQYGTESQKRTLLPRMMGYCAPSVTTSRCRARSSQRTTLIVNPPTTTPATQAKIVFMFSSPLWRSGS